MELKFVILYMACWIFATTIAATVLPNLQEEEVPDNDVAETSILGTLNALQTSQPSNTNNLDDGTYFPYEGVRENLYDTFVAPQPTLGVSINTRALLAPQVEVLHLTEDFITLSGDVMRRIHSLFTDNYDLFRVVCNIIVSKVTKLQTFAVKAISIIRKVLEFALHLFSNFSLTLPSITLGSAESEFAQHATYGVPSSNSTVAFQTN